MFDGFGPVQNAQVVTYEWFLTPQTYTTEFDAHGRFRVNLSISPPSPFVNVFIISENLTRPTDVVISLTFVLASGATHKVTDRLYIRPMESASTTIDIGASFSALGQKSCSVEVWFDEDGFNKPIGKKNLAYVGLLNQGATCYLNTVIQILFHIPEMRAIIYGMNVDCGKPDEQNVVLNLQVLFAKMESSTEACSTQDLTTSFGWKGTETHIQHDVQEFWNVLLANLEAKTRTGAIDGLFKGKYRQYVRCKRVNSQTNRIEEFHDLSLSVKNCASLYDSFRKFLEPEELIGDNQYWDEIYGRQDAVMGSDFVELPNVLALHLRRFEYSSQTGRMSKIRSRLDFPKDLDLSGFCPSIPPHLTKYQLFAVIVHSGQPESGHYCLYMRPFLQDQWYEFNDSIVTPVSADKAIKDNYGGELYGPGGVPIIRNNSAYMLIYVRNSSLSALFHPVPFPEVSQAAKEYLEREAERERIRELEKIENANNHYFAVVVDSLIEHKAQLSRFALPCGSDKKTPEYILVKKTDHSSVLYREVEEKLGIVCDSFRLYFIPTKGNSPAELVPNDDDHYVSEFVRPESGVLFVFDVKYDYLESDLEAKSSDDDDPEEQSFSFYRDVETTGTAFVFLYSYFPRSTGRPIHFCAPAIVGDKLELRHLAKIFRARYNLGANERVKIYRITNEKPESVSKKARFSAAKTRDGEQFLLEIVDTSICPSEYQLLSFETDDDTTKKTSYMELVGYPPTCIQYLQWLKTEKEVFVHGFGITKVVTIPLDVSPDELLSFFLNHVFAEYRDKAQGHGFLYANFASRPMTNHNLQESVKKTTRPYEELYDIWVHFHPKLEKNTIRVVFWLSHDSIFLTQSDATCCFLTMRSTALDLKKYVVQNFPEFHNQLDRLRVLSVDGYEIVRVLQDYEALRETGNPFRVEIIPPEHQGIDPDAMISITVQNRSPDDFVSFLMDLRPGEKLMDLKGRMLAKIRTRMPLHCLDNCQVAIQPWRQNKANLLHNSDVVKDFVDPSKREHLVITEREASVVDPYNPGPHGVKIYN